MTNDRDLVAELADRVQAKQRRLRLLISSDAPPGATLVEALDAGHISLVDVVESIRGAVPDPLAKPN